MTYRNKYNKYGYNSQQNESQQQLQESIQLTNHQMKLTLNVLHNTIEALEEYIDKVEKSGHYPNLKSKKQLFSKSINDPNRTSDELASDFLSQLYCLKAIVNKRPDDFRKKVKEEYYRWINATGIDINNCPDERLKHFLFEINEILEGRGEKFVEQTEKWLDEGGKNDPKDVLKIFGSFQVPVERNREQEVLPENKKNWNEVENESKFKGSDDKKGEQAFGRISNTVASRHDDFHFYPSQTASSNQNPQQAFFTPTGQEIRWDLIIDIGQNKNDWEIRKEVVVYDRYGGTKEELVCILKTARLDNRDYNQLTGELINQSGKVYKQDYFNDKEKLEINNIFGGSQTSASATSQRHYFTVPSQSLSMDKSVKPNDNKNNGTGKILGIFGIITVLVIGSVIVIRKQLNKKLKK